MWLKNEKPGRRPPPAKHVDLEHVSILLGESGRDATHGASMIYLKSQLPVQPMDRWLRPLPLSIVDQERMNRMMAVMVDPYARTKALLRSGTLDTIEANTCRYGRPSDYAKLRDEVQREMVEAGPPLPAWSEGVLGVFFGRDPALVYNEDQQPNQQPPKVADQASVPPPSPADLSSETTLRKRA